MADHRTWRRVGPAPAARGHRVEDAALLTGRGLAVRTVAGAGHTIHRDDFDGFMAALDGWI